MNRRWGIHSFTALCTGDDVLTCQQNYAAGNTTSLCFILLCCRPPDFWSEPAVVHFYSSNLASVILLNYNDTQPAVLCVHIDVYSQLELPVTCEACVTWTDAVVTVFCGTQRENNPGVWRQSNARYHHSSLSLLTCSHLRHGGRFCLGLFVDFCRRTCSKSDG